MKSSLSWIVTVMLPQRQLPERESLKEDRSCCFGSPVRCDILWMNGGMRDVRLKIQIGIGMGG